MPSLTLHVMPIPSFLLFASFYFSCVHSVYCSAEDSTNHMLKSRLYERAFLNVRIQNAKIKNKPSKGRGQKTSLWVHMKRKLWVNTANHSVTHFLAPVFVLISKWHWKWASLYFPQYSQQSRNYCTILQHHHEQTGKPGWSSRKLVNNPVLRQRKNVLSL